MIEFAQVYAIERGRISTRYLVGPKLLKGRFIYDEFGVEFGGFGATTTLLILTSGSALRVHKAFQQTYSQNLCIKDEIPVEIQNSNND